MARKAMQPQPIRDHGGRVTDAKCALAAQRYAQQRSLTAERSPRCSNVTTDQPSTAASPRF